MTQDARIPIEYARRLYDDVRGWYTDADSKAQVVLAIDGALVAFFTGAMFAKPNDLKSVVDSFSGWTWFFLALTGVCLLVSVVFAILCLWSRIYSAKELQGFVREAEKGSIDSTKCAATTMWFFQFAANHDEAKFLSTLQAVDDAFEIQSMASQIRILSRNVRTKHLLVNVGFLLATLTLILFFLAGVSYLFRNAL